MPPASTFPRPTPPAARGAHAQPASPRPARLLWAMLLLVGLAAGTAQAHGPTIEISHSELKPTLLNLFVGTTVHFANTVAMPGGHVIVDESGTLESPPLAEPGDGWHYTFERAGTYEVYIRQHPAARARIVVVPKKTP